MAGDPTTKQGQFTGGARPPEADGRGRGSGPTVEDAILRAGAILPDDAPSDLELFAANRARLRPDLEPMPRSTKMLIVGTAIVAVAVIAFSVLYTVRARTPGSPGGVAKYASASELSSGVLTASDVGGGWFPAPSPGQLDQAAVHGGPCASALWARDVGGYESAFIRGQGDFRNGEVISKVFEAGGAADAQAQQTFVGSRQFVPCLKAGAASDLRTLLGPTVDITKLDIRVDPLDPGFDVPAMGYTVTMDVDTRQLGTLTIANDVIEVFDGPYEGMLSLSSCTCAPVDPATLRHDVKEMALRVATLPGASSLMTPF